MPDVSPPELISAPGPVAPPDEPEGDDVLPEPDAPEELPADAVPARKVPLTMLSSPSRV